MARGVDDLVNHVLSEVALTGVQGAGSADFKRFVQSFYIKSHGEHDSQPQVHSGQPGPALYEKVWQWVISHADIRITHDGVVRRYSLAEFEAAEKIETNQTSTIQAVAHSATTSQEIGPAKSLLAIRDSIQQRLAKEGPCLNTVAISSVSELANTLSVQTAVSAPHTNSGLMPKIARAARVLPNTSNNAEPVFDDPQTNNSAPRIFASQNRIWQALTGHGIDLKKVPLMEFVLLSLIASHGEAGVTQPDLTTLSGQDKRSVPHRTDELCRKGYIEKRPVQSGKLRTSLCVHKKFVSDDHFLTSGKVEDVFQYKKFVLSGFVHLLYNKLKDAGVVPTRDIRNRLNVPMSTWNKRAVQGALIRLDQTGMVKRFRARRKAADENWLTCIEVLREPRPEDHENLKFRRQAAIEEVGDEQSDEDIDGETLMRDLEVDMLDTDTQERDGGKEDAGRIPPQWVPERLLSNTLHEVVAMGGTDGWDAGVLRDRIVGKFWRRPMESYLTRLTDDWEATQPAHIRHLALIRDTRNTQEKKFVHYVYRTYENFQKAADAGEVIWAGVSKPASKQSTAGKGGRPKKTGSEQLPVDVWGFRALNPKDFLNQDGSGSLIDCRAAIVHGRKHGPRWDNSLVEDIGYQKVGTPKADQGRQINIARPKTKIQSRLDLSLLKTPRIESSPATPARQELIADAAVESGDVIPASTAKVMGLPKRKYDTGLLTIEQRVALGLKPKGRLSKFVEDQVREHRKRTGDSASIPESIELERPTGPPAPPKLGPLMSKEERIAAGLPPRGRLGQKIEDQIREQRGFPKSTEKTKKPRKSRPANEPALLSKEQRIKLGIIPHGRLPQSLMEGLREEREFKISLEESKVIPAYLDAVKNKKSKADITQSIDRIRLQTLQQHDPTRGLDDADALTPALDEEDTSAEVELSTHTPSLEKRGADDDTTISRAAKRLCVESNSLTPEADTEHPLPLSTAVPDTNEPPETQPQSRVSTMDKIEDEVEHRMASSPSHTSGKTNDQPHAKSRIIDLPEVEARVRLIKEVYSSRSDPGLYLDPFAKRKIGQGRPRNAFIATFRLVQLSSLEWFTQESITNQEDTNEIQPCKNNANGATDHGLSSNGKSQTPETSDPILRGSPPSSNTIVTNDSLSRTPRGISDGSATNEKPGLDSSGLKIGQRSEGCVSSQAVAVTGANAETAHTKTKTDALQGPNQPVQPPPRGVTAWNAINKPSRTTSTYQSPYASSEHQEAGTFDERNSDNASGQNARNGVEESEIQGLCGPIMEEDTASRSARKLAAYMGTKTGGGSQKMFRHKIIMQIIDLCNGAYPLHGEIGRPFTTLWKKHHPNIAPPGSSTVLSNLRDMIADPRSGLKKLSFLIRLRHSAGVKKKDMVVYQHLTPTSPEVTKLAYKMANYSNSKAHQYYPEEVRHLVTEESFYVPMPVAPKDETISLEHLNPSLQHKIKEANLERRRRYYHKQKDEENARDAQNEGVEAPLKKTSTSNGQPRAKRARLASLNDKNKRYRRAPISNARSAPMDTEVGESIPKKASSDEILPELDSTQEKPLATPVCSDATSGTYQQHRTIPMETRTESSVSSIMAPVFRFSATNGTFSTEFGLVRKADLLGMPSPSMVAVKAAVRPKGTKRVQIIEPETQKPSKRVRVHEINPKSVQSATLVNSSSDDSDTSCSSSTSLSSDSEDDTPLMQLSEVRAKARAKEKAKAKARAKEEAKAEQRRSKKEPPPTLLERLTGLTGNPNDSAYVPPQPRLPSQKTYRKWNDRKKVRNNRRLREHKYSESQDPVDKFKKLCCTFAIASSMAWESGLVDWSIVEKVYSCKGFSIAKFKAVWAWLQVNMAAQITELAADFQARFIEAYESDRIAAIGEPSTYNWSNLVGWAMHTCAYPELSLPVYREALQQFSVDLSSFEALDRPKWHREKIADRVRIKLQLQHPYTAPLRPDTSRLAIDAIEVKARSWIRANTATPQSLYDSHTAHEKLKLLGNPVLTKVVGEYVERQMLRMRRLKRLLPGRNYTFTAKLAKKYGRTFDFDEFMAAVKIKKEMDAAFTQEDPEKRLYSISRAEPDGAIMAIMSLLSEGKVKFAPQIPSVNNKFGAQLPRLSIWGFMEGDYVHRGIDRQRLFWDIHVVPTETYNYGNPLQPEPAPPSSQAGVSTVWSPLPRPPLPGKDDSNALLPIWSSMDGQNVIWPWWYRILNLVLQPLIFQPGATVEDLHANCDEYTTEVFEIELVLRWLLSVNAVKKTLAGGYITLAGIWAVFGDILHDMDNDWLNTHVQRKHQKHQKQQWREQYHLRFSTLQGSTSRGRNRDSDESDMPTDDELEGTTTTGTDIMRRPKEQYAIARDHIATAAHTNHSQSADDPEQEAQPAAADLEVVGEMRTAEAEIVSELDIEMQDADDANDVDAEGEIDV